jgi:hypothetical protein
MKNVGRWGGGGEGDGELEERWCQGSGLEEERREQEDVGGGGWPGGRGLGRRKTGGDWGLWRLGFGTIGLPLLYNTVKRWTVEISSRA